MPNVFDQARSQSVVGKPATKTKQEVVILDREDPTQTKLAQAIDSFCAAQAALKEAEANKTAASQFATPACFRTFLDKFASAGVKPGSIKFQTDESLVTLIVQERKPTLDEAQISKITEIIGESKAQDIIKKEESFGFNSAIISKPGVIETLGRYLSAITPKLVEAGLLTQDECDNLIQATCRQTIKDGTLERLCTLCEGDVAKMAKLADALSSGVTAYIKK